MHTKIFYSYSCQNLSYRPRGFALVVTLSLLILLVILATGLLSLSAVSLRASTHGVAQHTARANARLAMMMAIAELQKHAGDDRRITADASISATSKQPDLVGVWKSWTPDTISNPARTISSNSYTAAKNDGFLGWLVSHPNPQETSTRSFAEKLAPETAPAIFHRDIDGIEVNASLVQVPRGAYAWAVSQEATRAKINIGGDQTKARDPNDALQVQPRPHLALSESFNHPSGDWNKRSGRVISLQQADLDTELNNSGTSAALTRNSFTVHSIGLLTDVVKGGLKTDLSLGFELPDADFSAASWGNWSNPFHSSGGPDYGPTIRNNYKGQRPLFAPITPTATHTALLNNFQAAQVRFDYPGAGVPTFDLLRSFYRIPHHLYKTADGVTAFERHSDHIAFQSTRLPSGLYPTPWAPPPAAATQGSVRPVLDRVMFLLSTGLTTDSRPSLVITPVITMWNPYNVALEIEGAVAYTWLDVPFGFDYIVYNASGGEARRHRVGMSGFLGAQFDSWPHGRSVDPYFYAAITANGARLPDRGAVPPIRFKPGEVRVFAPTSPVPSPFQKPSYGGNYNSTVNISGITTYLRPVENLRQYSTGGGLAAQISGTPLQQGESAEIHFRIASGEDYPCFISVEDATRAKGTRATNKTRGQALIDVIQRNYGQSGEFGQSLGDRSSGFRSIRQTFQRLRAEPAPFAVIEFYHRYARTGKEQGGDIVYTANPRQPWMSQYMTNANLRTSGLQYQLRVRGPLNTFNDLLQTDPGSQGRRALYGPSNRSDGNPSGKGELSFFELPQAPLLSLASFQHADLSSTPFGPANQFGNSWASAYIPSTRTSVNAVGSGENAKPPIYDIAYLTNEALWDGFFFSGAAPTIAPTQTAGSIAIWNTPTGNIQRPLREVVTDFVRKPSENPLRNPRMRLQKGDVTEEKLIERLLSPQGCVQIAAHLMLDGAFNVNSTSEEAWIALLSGLRGTDFSVTNGSPPSGSTTAFPRFRNPIGTENDHWHGFRTLSDDQIKELAEKIVTEVQVRGPFLSLAEFVNRQLGSGSAAMKGTIQSAIDATSFNDQAKYDRLQRSSFPTASARNLTDASTGIGIPGYLTQADVLQSLAPVITVRADTFTIRGYGEARDSNDKVIAKAWCEAIVQRNADFVDSTDDAYSAVSDPSRSGDAGYVSRGTLVNQAFGRRYSIVLFRYLAPSEVLPLTS